jgi:hypothetical protein
MTTIVEAMKTITAVEGRIRDGIAATAAERDNILGAMDAEATKLTEDVLETLETAYQMQARRAADADLAASPTTAQIRAAEEAIGATAQPAPQLARDLPGDVRLQRRAAVLETGRGWRTRDVPAADLR